MLRFKMQLGDGGEDSSVVKVMALHVTDPDSVPGSPNGVLGTAKSEPGALTVCGSQTEKYIHLFI